MEDYVVASPRSIYKAGEVTHEWAASARLPAHAAPRMKGGVIDSYQDFTTIQAVRSRSTRFPFNRTLSPHATATDQQRQ